jgi:hypothetical protein
MEPDPDPNRKNRVIALAFLAETPEQAIELEQIASEMPEVPRQIGDQDI